MGAVSVLFDSSVVFLRFSIGGPDQGNDGVGQRSVGTSDAYLLAKAVNGKLIRFFYYADGEQRRKIGNINDAKRKREPSSSRFLSKIESASVLAAQRFDFPS